MRVTEGWALVIGWCALLGLLQMLSIGLDVVADLLGHGLTYADMLKGVR